jgi:predicted TIM-barrel fold metal-dependent hydrolase
MGSDPRRWQKGHELHAPSLIGYELANVAWKKLRRARAHEEAAAALDRRGPLTVDEVRSVVDHTGGTEPRDFLPDGTEPDANLAFGALEFLYYMLARRSVSLAGYRNAYAPQGAARPIDTAIGALVDFDYWIDCPPFSAHEDQIELHALLSSLNGGYMRPLLAYNPWTDIALKGAGLRRIKTEWSKAKSPFVGVKIYPPMGFYPAGNLTNPIITRKKRPNAGALDNALGEFFDFCASEQVPVLAHTGQSNGRDTAHDELGGPTGWDALLAEWAGRTPHPILSFGHFGGASKNQWTQTLASLIGTHKDARVYADIGYWDELVGTPEEATPARERLKAAIGVAVGAGTVADRVMFGTDWLMLSQQRRWKQYPQEIAAVLEDIAPDHWRNMLGANALACFPRLAQPVES